MADAVRGTAKAPEQDQFDAERADSSDECIITVHPAVVEHVGHAFGNFFQRIYHLVDQVRRSDAAAAAHLGGSIEQLEDFLQLVMDYFSPLPLALQRVASAEVAQSLGRQVSDVSGCPVKIGGKCLEGELLVDPGQLTRAFGLLARQLAGDDVDTREHIQLNTMKRRSGRCLVLTIGVPAPATSRRSSEAEMRWAVAQKILETHGGTLQQHSEPSGETLWEIALPLQS